MPNKEDLIAIRPYKEEDKNFILATFLRGVYYGDSWFSLIPKNIFMAHYHIFAENLIARPGVSIRIACLKEDPEVILGYSISKGDAIDWVFVKNAWRGIGIAKSLVPDGVKFVTHLTKSGLAIIKKHPEVQFNPFAL
jgi:hypothetical protein